MFYGLCGRAEAGRQAELGRLLALVRFPMMAEPAPAIMKEPLISGHPRALQLLYETHPHFGRSAQAAACPRLRPRKGQRLGGLPALAFTSFSGGCYTSERQRTAAAYCRRLIISLCVWRSARGT